MLTTEISTVQSAAVSTRKQLLKSLAKSRQDANAGRVKDMGVALEELRAKYHL